MLAFKWKLRYTDGLLSTPSHIMSRPRAVLVGCLIGLIVASSRPSLSAAQATLLFPPPLVLNDAQKPTQTLKNTEKSDLSSAPAAWAEEVLMSKEAVDTVCKKIERSETEDRAEILRSACLLAEDHRVDVETMPNSCIRLTVRAANAHIATVLCDAMLAYLTYRTKIPLEDPEREELTSREQQLRLQEKNLSTVLWGLLSFDAPKNQNPNAMGLAELDMQDYQGAVAEYRQMMRTHFFREAKAAAAGPNFTVLESPTPVSSGRPWVRYTLLGGIGGLVASLLAQGISRSRSLRKKVRWRIQEGDHRARTAPASLLDSVRQGDVE